MSKFKLVFYSIIFSFYLTNLYAIPTGFITIGPGIRKFKHGNFESSYIYSNEISFVYMTGPIDTKDLHADVLGGILWASAGYHFFNNDNSEINKYVYYGEIGIYNIGFGYTREISDMDYYHLFVGLPLPIPVSNAGFLPYVMLYMRRGWGREDRSQKFKEYGIMAKIGFEVL